MKGFLFLATALTVGTFSASSAVWANDADSQASSVRTGTPTRFNMKVNIHADPIISQFVANGFELVFPKGAKTVEFESNPSLAPAFGSLYSPNGIRAATLYEKGWKDESRVGFWYQADQGGDSIDIVSDKNPVNGADGYSDFMVQKAVYDDFLSEKRNIAEFPTVVRTLSGTSVFATDKDVYFPHLVKSKNGTAVGIGYFTAIAREGSVEDVYMNPIEGYHVVRISPNGEATLSVSAWLNSAYIERTATPDGWSESSVKLPDSVSGSMVREERMKAWNTYVLGRKSVYANLRQDVGDVRYVITESTWWNEENPKWVLQNDKHFAYLTQKTGSTSAYVLAISKAAAIKSCQDEILAEDEAWQCNRTQDIRGTRKVFELYASEKDESENLKRVWESGAWLGYAGQRGLSIIDVRNTGTGKYLVLSKSPQYVGANNLDLAYFEYDAKTQMLYQLHDDLENYLDNSDSETADDIEKLYSDAGTGFRSGKFENPHLQDFYDRFIKRTQETANIAKESGIQP